MYKSLNINFHELLCPCCKEPMQNGATTLGVDTKVNKFCKDCDIHIVLLLLSDDYEYELKRTLRKKEE